MIMRLEGFVEWAKFESWIVEWTQEKSDETRGTLNFKMLQFEGQLKDLLFVKIIVFVQKYF